MNTQRILDPARNAWTLAEASRAGLLIDGRAYYRAFHEAATRARRSILIAGWQFDTGVALLRGEDKPSLEPDPRGPPLLPFLAARARDAPELRIDILAWDFSLVYALERELLQKILFNWGTTNNVRFRFDGRCAPTGSHHQKFVVIDDAIAFVGSIDLCEHRWDDRTHAAVDPCRIDPDGTPYGPYHEVQAFVTGEAAQRMTELFARRWRDAGHEPIAAHVPSREPARHLEDVPTRPSIELGPGPVAVSRTRPRCEAGDEGRYEVRTLFEDAIATAERLVYVETQYFTSRAILRALVARMRAPGRSSPEIVLVLPQRVEDKKEELAVGSAQAEVLATLVEEARRTSTPLGIWNVASRAGDGSDVFEYVHSKVLAVDDRFLSVGSANLTNRSMGVDTELHVSWEATDPGAPLARAIRRARVSLLAEHAGARGTADVRSLVRPEGLVARLEAMASGPTSRLRRYDLVPSSAPTFLADILDPEEPPTELWTIFGAKDVPAPDPEG